MNSRGKKGHCCWVVDYQNTDSGVTKSITVTLNDRSSFVWKMDMFSVNKNLYPSYGHAGSTNNIHLCNASPNIIRPAVKSSTVYK